jgi:hypothetical protein
MESPIEMVSESASVKVKALPMVMELGSQMKLAMGTVKALKLYTPVQVILKA